MLDDLDRGRGRSLAIFGQPGVGKTHLGQRLLECGSHRGHLALYGAAAEFEQSTPFAALIDALDPVLRAGGRGDISDGHREQLAELLVALARLRSDPLGSTSEIAQIHRAADQLLGTLAAQQPILLMLDNLQWADPETIGLVMRLLQHRPRGPVGLALSYRSGSVPAGLDATVTASRCAGNIMVFALQPLSREATDALVGDELDPALRQTVYRESGGNPFYAQELARLHLAHPGMGLPVPTTIRATLSQEIAALSTPAQSMLQAAAVLGDPFDIDVAAEVAEVVHDSDAAVHELLRRELIRRSGPGGRFAMRHPIVRRAVYEGAGGGWRIAAHQRAAAALTQRGAALASVAYHVEQAPRHGDASAIAVLHEAGRAAAAAAPMEAVRWLRAALRLLPADDTARRLELLGALATCLLTAGRTSEGQEVTAEAEALLPRGDAHPPAQTLALAGRAEYLSGRNTGAARALMTDALTRAAEPATRAVLHAALAVDHHRAGDGETALAHASMAHELGQLLGERRLRAFAAAVLAHVRCRQGDVVQAQVDLALADELITELADDELAERLEPLVWVANACLALERHAAAVAHCERGLAIVQATGQALFITRLRVIQGHALVRLGRLEAAARCAEAAIEASARADEERSAPWAYILACSVATSAGSLSRALEAGEEAIRLAQRHPSPTCRATAHAYYARAQIVAGDGAAAGSLVAHAGGTGLTHLAISDRVRWFSVMAEAALSIEDTDAARGWVQRAERLAKTQYLAGRTALAWRARAALRLALGDFSGAAQLAAAAAAAFGRGDQPIEAARAQTLAGRALARLGHADRAVVVLEHAHGELAALGAERFRDEVARDLRALGRRPSRRSTFGAAVSDSGEEDGRSVAGAAAGLADLSAREREVADLVARGLTNRAIAAALVLSEKTVESHLSRVFAKLGVTSRVHVARVIARADARRLAATADSAS